MAFIKHKHYLVQNEPELEGCSYVMPEWKQYIHYFSPIVPNITIDLGRDDYFIKIKLIDHSYAS